MRDFMGSFNALPLPVGLGLAGVVSGADGMMLGMPPLFVTHSNYTW
jgi:hypothetical protein